MAKSNNVPSCVIDIKNQINNTLELLKTRNLIKFYNEIKAEYLRDSECYRLSWNNHVGGRSVGSKAFLKIEQYMHILNTGSYHAILFDYSIIRVSFTFRGNELISQNLLWWPCPVEFTFEDEEYDSFGEIVELFLEDLSYFRMRSPIRIDLDVSNVNENHPKAHMHIQSPDTRLNTNDAICFNTFIKFIFNNFYSNITFDNKEFPSRNIKSSRADKIEYSNKHSLVIHQSY